MAFNTTLQANISDLLNGQITDWDTSSNTTTSKNSVEDTVPMLSFFMFILILNIVMHSVGIMLVYSTLRRNGMIQQLIILHLGISELLKNIIKMYRYTYRLLKHFYPMLPPVLEEIRKVVKLCHRWGTYPLYFLFMVYLTVDRLMGTILTLSYKIHVTKKLVKCIIGATWAAIALLAAILATGQYTKAIQIAPLFPTYIYCSLHVFYLLLAVVTYSLMFHKFTQSRKMHSTKRRKKDDVPLPGSVKGITQAFKESRFFICVMIITSFLLMSVIPGFFYIVLILRKIHKTYPNLKLVIHLCYILSDTVDALIYIFLQRSIRKLLMYKIMSVFKCIFCRKAKYEQESFRDRHTTMTVSTRSATVVGRSETVELLPTSKQNGAKQNGTKT